MYSLDCPHFKYGFDKLDDLLAYVIKHGIDPNYEITRFCEPTGEKLIDYLQF